LGCFPKENDLVIRGLSCGRVVCIIYKDKREQIGVEGADGNIFSIPYYQLSMNDSCVIVFVPGRLAGICGFQAQIRQK